MKMSKKLLALILMSGIGFASICETVLATEAMGSELKSKEEVNEAILEEMIANEAVEEVNEEESVKERGNVDVGVHYIVEGDLAVFIDPTSGIRAEIPLTNLNSGGQPVTMKVTALDDSSLVYNKIATFEGENKDNFIAYKLDFTVVGYGQANPDNVELYIPVPSGYGSEIDAWSIENNTSQNGEYSFSPATGEVNNEICEIKYIYWSMQSSERYVYIAKAEKEEDSNTVESSLEQMLFEYVAFMNYAGLTFEEYQFTDTPLAEMVLTITELENPESYIQGWKLVVPYNDFVDAAHNFFVKVPDLKKVTTPHWAYPTYDASLDAFVHEGGGGDPTPAVKVEGYKEVKPGVYDVYAKVSNEDIMELSSKGVSEEMAFSDESMHKKLVMRVHENGKYWKVESSQAILTFPVEYQEDQRFIQDESTGINVTAGVGVLKDGTEVKVDSIKEGSGSYTLVSGALAEVASKYQAFDISLSLDGEVVQPESGNKVKVSMPIPEGYNPEYIDVYYIDDAGNKTKLDITVTDGIVHFYVDHFSIYAIAEQIGTSVNPTPGGNENSNTTPEAPQENGGGNQIPVITQVNTAVPDTNDESNVLVYLYMMLVALIGTAIVSGRLKKSSAKSCI